MLALDACIYTNIWHAAVQRCGDVDDQSWNKHLSACRFTWLKYLRTSSGWPKGMQKLPVNACMKSNMHMQEFYYYAESDACKIYAKDDWSNVPITKITIASGQIALLPAGCVHAVHTPIDTVAVACNFFEIASWDKYCEWTNLLGFNRDYGHPTFKNLTFKLVDLKAITLTHSLNQYIKNNAQKEGKRQRIKK